MINISPYIDKLDILREYMGLLIDGKIMGRIWFNANAFPDLPLEKLMKIYNETGVMFCNCEEPTKFEQYTFEEWLETRSQSALQ